MCACVCVVCGDILWGEGIEISTKGPGGHGEAGHDWRGLWLGAQHQIMDHWRNAPPAHAGVAAGPQVSVRHLPLPLSSVGQKMALHVRECGVAARPPEPACALV